MTPETISAFRTRICADAKKLLRQAILDGVLEVRVKNGNGQRLPNAAEIGANFAVREDWEAVRIPGMSVSSALVGTRIGAQMFKAETVRFQTAGALAAFLGGPWPKWWAQTYRLLDALPALRAEGPVSALIGLSTADVAVLYALCRWRSSVSDDEVGTLLLREAKAEGMGTKWIEGHSRAVITIFDALGWGVPDGQNLGERLGFLNPDASQVWVRLSPETAKAHGIWERFSVPSRGFGHLPFAPDAAIIIENEATFLKFPVGPGQIVVWGSGAAIVATSARMEWLAAVPLVVYWGDLDGAGYLILDRLRKTLPHAQSLLMGDEDVLENAHMGVPESPSEAVKAQMPRLTASEAAGRKRAHEAGLRIEQERIPMRIAEELMRRLGKR